MVFSLTTVRSEVSTAGLRKLPKGKRLDKAGVISVLKNGRRISGRAFDVWATDKLARAYGNGSRVAIAVSKKQLGSAVARNRIRRVAREVFRAHPVAHGQMDVLVKYRSRSDARKAAERSQIIDELGRLFSKVASVTRPA